MIRRVVHTRAQLAAMFAAVLAAATPVAAQTGGGAKHPGVEFEMKATISVSGAMAGVLGGMGPGYTAHGVAAGTRMRIDIIDGAFPPLAEKGDYILFDTSGMTVVHPATKEFVPIPKDFASKALEQMQAMGMSITIGAVDMTLDSLPGTDTIAGFPTRHFKMTAGYTMTLDGMGASQEMKSSGTTEYWMATVPGLASSPLQRTGQLSGGSQPLNGPSSGPFKDIAVRSDSLMRRMTGTAVRARTTTNSDTPMGAMGIDIASEMTSVKQASIADTMFVVPSAYARGASPFPSGGN
jgi:hypothetical protein